MTPIQAKLNEIKWDSRENPEDYRLIYYDRIQNRKIALPYAKIKKGIFIRVNNIEEIHIPLHRIRQANKK